MTIRKKKRLFVDTDVLTTKFYSNFLLEENSKENKYCSLLADTVNNITDWNHVLFLEVDVDFVQDGTRSEEICSDRKKYSEQIKQLF